MATIASILLVDDEPDIRTIAEMSLTHVGGWKTLIASSGVEALELASKHKPDVILLDVMMPEMDGVTTFQALAAKSETSSIPVIFMTAKVQSHERERYVNFGAAGVIAKPFDPMRLPQDIQNILAQPSGTRGRTQLELLRRRYAETLGGKLEDLRTALDAVRRAEPDQRDAAIQTAYRLAHNLHGTAGTYGHPHVSEAMASVESALQRLRETTADDACEECWRLIEVSLDRASRSD